MSSAAGAAGEGGSPPVGTLGRYRLERTLGRGGMAEVYCAVDTALDRRVAVKVILPGLAADASFVERFLREARLVAALDHPNVVPIWDVGEEVEAGDLRRPYLVMPLLDGGSLASRLDGRSWPLGAALVWLRQLAAALDHAHARGILHRDVKPANVLLGRDGRVLLSDFGIAKSTAGSSQLTVTGAVVGTPVYMAPEVARGAPASAASDRYALAVLAYELLTGRPPFVGENALSLLHQHVTAVAPPATTWAPALPPRVDEVLAVGLAKEPERRPATARALVEGLADAGLGQAGEARGDEVSRADAAGLELPLFATPTAMLGPTLVESAATTVPGERAGETAAAAGPARARPSGRTGRPANADSATPNTVRLDPQAGPSGAGRPALPTFAAARRRPRVPARLVGVVGTIALLAVGIGAGLWLAGRGAAPAPDATNAAGAVQPDTHARVAALDEGGEATAGKIPTPATGGPAPAAADPGMGIGGPVPGNGGTDSDAVGVSAWEGGPAAPASPSGLTDARPFAPAAGLPPRNVAGPPGSRRPVGGGAAAGRGWPGADPRVEGRSPAVNLQAPAERAALDDRLELLLLRGYHRRPDASDYAAARATLAAGPTGLSPQFGQAVGQLAEAGERLLANDLAAARAILDALGESTVGPTFAGVLVLLLDGGRLGHVAPSWAVALAVGDPRREAADGLASVPDLAAEQPAQRLARALLARLDGQHLVSRQLAEEAWERTPDGPLRAGVAAFLGEQAQLTGDAAGALRWFEVAIAGAGHREQAGAYALLAVRSARELRRPDAVRRLLGIACEAGTPFACQATAEGMRRAGQRGAPPAN